ncbi:HERC6, partial [Symbiodinium pilosum]
SPSKTPAPIRKRSVCCAKAAVQQCSPRRLGNAEAEEDEVELDFSPARPGDSSPFAGHRQERQGDEQGSRRESRVAEAWLRLARIVLLELGTRGPEPSTAIRSCFNAGREAHCQQQEGLTPEADDNEEFDASADWRSPKVCLSYLLGQSVTWIEPESDEDDFHSPKASLQKPPDEEDEEEAHPGMKAIAQQQRAPGIVEGLPKCLSF